MQDRQLYPDFLRASSIAKIAVFHFVGWQLLTYIPSLGIMFALGGWFVANSLNGRPAHTVIYQRLARLLPTWWVFALLTLIGGFFYAVGAGKPFHITPAWAFPYQQATWSLDNDYSNDAIVVTWYIATYLWLMLLSPLFLYIYKKISWLTIFIPVIAMIIYSHYFTERETLFGETWYSVLTFAGCWMLGFAKADGTIDKVPRYLVWATMVVCCACGISLTYNTQALSSDSVALSVMSFGIAMLLLSFNPDLSFLPQWLKNVIRTMNTYAVTIYLFHNILIDVANKLGGYLNVYEVGNTLHAYAYTGYIGDWICFSFMVGLMYLTVKTVGIVETHKWIKR